MRHLLKPNRTNKSSLKKRGFNSDYYSSDLSYETSLEKALELDGNTRLQFSKNRIELEVILKELDGLFIKDSYTVLMQEALEAS